MEGKLSEINESGIDDNRNDCLESGDLVSVERVPEKFRHIYSNYMCFNRIQSSIFNDVFETDASLVVSAPTGSGKTVVFELAITRLIRKYDLHQAEYNFMIIYVAPIKALCEERMLDWHKKFSSLGINCISVTGDSDIVSVQNLSNHNLIITTPEKWDSLTRRWRNNIGFINRVILFMIDEVHLLNDEARGPTLEAIMSRMKTIEDSKKETVSADLLQKIRFLAISATIPNVEDIAEWTGTRSLPAKYFNFSDEARPVKLMKIVQGYYFNPQMSTPFKFDIMLSYKLQGIILQYSNGKPTLIFCSTRKSVEMTTKHLSQNLTITLNGTQKSILQQAASQITTPGIKEILIHGVGSHHAGMLPDSRRIIETLFRNGDLPILVTTSTLAMGINLPAHLVIIKSTKYYTKGEYKDYSESVLLQMIGRAGRPQFDTYATAVILTTSADKVKFENMIGGTQCIESNLHKHLTEHLNAEIVLRTITDIGIAKQWLTSTFLHIRARKHPTYYGFSANLNQDQLDKKLMEMCQIEINKLERVGMILIENSTILPTEMGSLMAKFCVHFETMKLFKEVKGTEVLQQILSLISKCHEFSDLYLRVNDKKTLNLLNKCKNRETIRFPFNGKIKTLDMKINCIIQAVFGCLQILEPSLLNEAQKIMRIGERISKCLADYLETKKNCFSALLNALILAKCFHCRIWENSPYVSRQLSGIGAVMSSHLVVAGKKTFQSLLETNPRNLEMILHRKPPMGDTIISAVELLPQYKLKLEEAKISSTKSKVKVVIQLINYEKLEYQLTIDSQSFMDLVIGDDSNNILLHEKFTHSFMIDNQIIEKEIPNEFNEQTSIHGHFISENWVGIDCTYTLELFTKPNHNPRSSNTTKAVKPSKKLEKLIDSSDKPFVKNYINQYFKIIKKNAIGKAQNVQIDENSNVQNCIDFDENHLLESDNEISNWEPLDEKLLESSDDQEISAAIDVIENTITIQNQNDEDIQTKQNTPDLVNERESKLNLEVVKESSSNIIESNQRKTRQTLPSLSIEENTNNDQTTTHTSSSSTQDTNILQQCSEDETKAVDLKKPKKNFHVDIQSIQITPNVINERELNLEIEERSSNMIKTNQKMIYQAHPSLSNEENTNNYQPGQQTSSYLQTFDTNLQHSSENVELKKPKRKFQFKKKAQHKENAPTEFKNNKDFFSDEMINEVIYDRDTMNKTSAANRIPNNEQSVIILNNIEKLDEPYISKYDPKMVALQDKPYIREQINNIPPSAAIQHNYNEKKYNSKSMFKEEGQGFQEPLSSVPISSMFSDNFESDMVSVTPMNQSHRDLNNTHHPTNRNMNTPPYNKQLYNYAVMNNELKLKSRSKTTLNINPCQKNSRDIRQPQNPNIAQSGSADPVILDGNSVRSSSITPIIDNLRELITNKNNSSQIKDNLGCLESKELSSFSEEEWQDLEESIHSAPGSVIESCASTKLSNPPVHRVESFVNNIRAYNIPQPQPNIPRNVEDSSFIAKHTVQANEPMTMPVISDISRIQNRVPVQSPNYSFASISQNHQNRPGVFNNRTFQTINFNEINHGNRGLTVDENHAEDACVQNNRELGMTSFSNLFSTPKFKRKAGANTMNFEQAIIGNSQEKLDIRGAFSYTPKKRVSHTITSNAKSDTPPTEAADELCQKRRKANEFSYSSESHGDKKSIKWRNPLIVSPKIKYSPKNYTHNRTNGVPHRSEHHTRTELLAPQLIQESEINVRRFPNSQRIPFSQSVYNQTNSNLIPAQSQMYQNPMPFSQSQIRGSSEKSKRRTSFVPTSNFSLNTPKSVQKFPVTDQDCGYNQSSQRVKDTQRRCNELNDFFSSPVIDVFKPNEREMNFMESGVANYVMENQPEIVNVDNEDGQEWWNQPVSAEKQVEEELQREIREMISKPSQTSQEILQTNDLQFPRVSDRENYQSQCSCCNHYSDRNPLQYYNYQNIWPNYNNQEIRSNPQHFYIYDHCPPMQWHLGNHFQQVNGVGSSMMNEASINRMQIVNNPNLENRAFTGGYRPDLQNYLNAQPEQTNFKDM